MSQCARCKGRGFCGRRTCAIMQKMLVQTDANKNFKKDFQGAAPNVFVGHNFYPKVRVGLLATDIETSSGDTHSDNFDNPLHWSKENYDMGKIINLRSNLVNSNFRSNIHAPVMPSISQSEIAKFNEISKEISLSRRAVDTEVHLQDKPQFRVSYNQEATPHGPSVGLHNAKLTENVRVPTKVDKVVSDDAFKSTSALNYLYKHDFDEHYLTKILSVGNLGVKHQRKLVPTRWAITAVDDALGKNTLKEIKGISNQMNFYAYFGGHLGNYFLILFFPDVWGYEFFETSLPGSLYNADPNASSFTDSDFEFYNGRKEYANNTAGAYYAVKLAILDHLKNLKRQGSVLALRFITEEYFAPLGVWVVREAARKALLNKPLEFGSKELMLLYAKKLINKKYNFDISRILSSSQLLKQSKVQKKVFDF